MSVEPVAINPEGEHYHYVADQILLPQSAVQANEFGLNLDGDQQGRGDNALGQILSYIFGSSDRDLNLETRMKVDAGEILHLLDVQTVSLDSAQGVGVTLRHGLDTDGDPTDNFSGSEAFAIDEARGSGRLTGLIDEGSLEVALGTVPIAVVFAGLDEPFLIDLDYARIVASIDGSSIEGRLGGGMTEATIEEDLLPAMHEGATRLVEQTCTGGQCTDDFAEYYLLKFDADEDGYVTLEELMNDRLVQSLLAPDVDLLNGDVYAPRCDGVKDHLSFGLHFHAVRAELQ